MGDNMFQTVEIDDELVWYEYRFENRITTFSEYIKERKEHLGIMYMIYG